ncbi:hypothetical protein niasHT_028852 [Heterodera trifolii]|uniref:CCHC-type domain-containing protein n=1 Tax=Heterodera trifolii TaxID=157864 RepID=A0ABD2KQE0_9BILA
MKSEVGRITENLDTLQGRVQLLEYEQDEYGRDAEWMEDENFRGQVFSPEQNDKRNDISIGECEIMVSDPFLGGIAPLEGYDGNPSVSFSRWVARLEDMLSLYPQLTEPQKLSRLRILLRGQARAEFESIEPAPETLVVALEHLKMKFENENTRSIARQTMVSCRQAPGERVEFANRLNEVVRTALSGESEGIIRKRLFEEFLEKLTPELQFEVKAGRPTSYSNAYEIAQHFELLLAAKRPSQISVADSMAELSQKVEALTVHQQTTNKSSADRRACYYCRRPGHLVKDCREKRRDEERGGHRDQRGGRFFREERRWSRERNERENRHFTPRGGGQRNHRSNHRSPTPYGEGEGNNSNRWGSQGRRVNFRGRVGAARLASPIFLALMVILSIFGNGSAINQASNPMICHPESPSSLWSIPVDPICPNWAPTELPVAMNLPVFRLNTVKYKTKATACRCIKTKIARRIGIVGGRYEEVATNTVEVPTATCRKMKEFDDSPAGKLFQINGTFKATQNSLEPGWRSWPMGIFWKTMEILNCYLYETVVFARHGASGLSTPINDCPACSYQAGSCCCAQLSLIWRPDHTQLCNYVKVAEWKGEYSTDIWTANSGDFALTFVNRTDKADCDGKWFVASDQSFAIPRESYLEMIDKSEWANSQNRKKREIDNEDSVGLQIC